MLSIDTTMVPNLFAKEQDAILSKTLYYQRVTIEDPDIQNHFLQHLNNYQHSLEKDLTYKFYNEGIPIGFITLGLYHPFIYLDIGAFKPGFGKRIGRYFIDHHLYPEGYYAILWIANPDNYASIKLSNALGFTEEHYRDYILIPPFNDLVYRRSYDYNAAYPLVKSNEKVPLLLQS